MYTCSHTHTYTDIHTHTWEIDIHIHITPLRNTYTSTHVHRHVYIHIHLYTHIHQTHTHTSGNIQKDLLQPRALGIWGNLSMGPETPKGPILSSTEPGMGPPKHETKTKLGCWRQAGERRRACGQPCLAASRDASNSGVYGPPPRAQDRTGAQGPSVCSASQETRPRQEDPEGCVPRHGARPVLTLCSLAGQPSAWSDNSSGLRCQVGRFTGALEPVLAVT